MRCVAFLVMIALTVGAVPACAQDSPTANPTHKRSAAAPAHKHVRHRAAKTQTTPVGPKQAHRSRSAKANAHKKQAAKGKVPLPQAAPARAVTVNSVPLPAARPGEGKPTDAKIVATAPVPVPTAKPAAAKPTAAKPVETKTAAIKPAERVAELIGGIPRDEWPKIQAALLWAGDYKNAQGGEETTDAAIRNFQKRNKGKVTGVLTPSERASLVDAAKRHENEFGWTVMVDPATGIRMGVPTKLVPQARDAPHGTLWSSVHGEVRIETFRIKEPGLTLAALFEREKKQPANRHVESSALHDDSFAMSGMQGLKLFAVHAKMRDGEIRGYTMAYDQMMEGIVAPVTAAVLAAFSPFPERSAPYAALARPVEYGNGLVVSGQGHIVTNLQLTRGCQVIVAAGLGNADRVAMDEQHGLALLRVYGARKLTPVTLAQDLTKTADLTLVGIPDPKEQDGTGKLTEIKARLNAGDAIELRRPVPMAGLSGAAALDAQGHVLGMLQIGHAVLASADAALPPVRLMSAEVIRGFLAAHNVPAPEAPPADAKGAVVRLICVRK